MVALLDARIGRKPTGIGNYVLGLCEQFGRLAPESVRPVCRIQHGRRFRGFGLRPILASPRGDAMPSRLPRVDVVHGPNFHAPAHATAARVATIHDVGYVLLPDCHPPGLSERLDGLVREALPSTAAFICVSTDTRDAFIDIYPVAPERCHVVPHGVDPAVFHEESVSGEQAKLRRRYGIERPFVLFVGAMVPRKDLLTLVRAFGVAAGRLGDAELVLAGNKTLRWASDWPRVSEWLDEHPDVRSRVRVLNFVAPADLPALYRASSVVALTSLIEGFGFTVLEAFACGRPVVATRSSALPEIGGSAAYYGEARNAESFAAAIESAWAGEDWERRRREAGLIVSSHTWQRAAARTLDVYDKVT